MSGVIEMVRVDMAAGGYHRGFVGAHGCAPAAYVVRPKSCGRTAVRPYTSVTSTCCAICTVVLFEFLYALAAATNDRNSGCGVPGRERYSGWNWQPTNQGWPSSSMISTNLPSGEMPVTRKPR